MLLDNEVVANDGVGATLLSSLLLVANIFMVVLVVFERKRDIKNRAIEQAELERRRAEAKHRSNQFELTEMHELAIYKGGGASRLRETDLRYSGSRSQGWFKEKLSKRLTRSESAAS